MTLLLICLSTDYDALIRQVERQRNVNETIPAFFIKTLVTLEDFLNTSIAKEKEAKKKMKAPNAKAMNGMKQKLKKNVRENQDAVDKFRQVSGSTC